MTTRTVAPAPVAGNVTASPSAIQRTRAAIGRPAKMDLVLALFVDKPSPHTSPRGDLTREERDVLTVLVLRRHDKTDRCNPAIETIAKDALMSRRKVVSVLKALETRGYIARERRKVARCLNLPNQYRILWGSLGWSPKGTARHPAKGTPCTLSLDPDEVRPGGDPDEEPAAGSCSAGEMQRRIFDSDPHLSLLMRVALFELGEHLPHMVDMAEGAARKAEAFCHGPAELAVAIRDLRRLEGATVPRAALGPAIMRQRPLDEDTTRRVMATLRASGTISAAGEALLVT